VPAPNTVYRFGPRNTTGIGNVGQQQFARIYPTNATASFSIDAPAGTQYEVLSANGSNVASGLLNATGRGTVDVSTLAPGLYIVRLQYEGAWQAAKVVKQ
jgi:hypothetical protein